MNKQQTKVVFSEGSNQLSEKELCEYNKVNGTNYSNITKMNGTVWKVTTTELPELTDEQLAIFK